MKWDILCLPKKEGGMGFKDLANSMMLSWLSKHGDYFRIRIPYFIESLKRSSFQTIVYGKPKILALVHMLGIAF